MGCVFVKEREREREENVKEEMKIYFNLLHLGSKSK